MLFEAVSAPRAPPPTQSAVYNLVLLGVIEFMVLFCSAILALLVFVGSSRRRSGSAALRLVLRCAFAVSYPAAAYTIGLMQSFSLHHKLFLVWSCFFLLVLTSADYINVYTALADFASPTTLLLKRGLPVLSVSGLLLSYTLQDLDKEMLRICVFIVWLVGVGKIWSSTLAHRLALRSDRLETDNKLIADYMTYQEEINRRPVLTTAGTMTTTTTRQDDGDPVTMKGYRYIVRGEETDVSEPEAPDYVRKVDVDEDDARGLVTVERVWQCKGRLLSGGDAAPAARRDLCLSFALFKLLRRRCSTYPLAESGKPKTRDFVLKGLLLQAGGDDDGATTRAFRVIQVELGFLYDMFYTRYPYICHASVSTAPHLAMCAVVVAIGVFTLPSLRQYPEDQPSIIVAHDVNFDVALTVFVIVLVIVLEAYQFIAVLFSDWQKVKMLCRYVLQPSWQGNPLFEVVLGVLCSNLDGGTYWKKTMSQYSIVRHASPGHAVKDCLSRVTRRWLDNLMYTGKMRSVKVSPAVERALASALRGCGDGVLSDGRASVRQFGTDERALRAWGDVKCTCTHTILIWHIATCLCEMEMEMEARPRPRARKAGGGDDHRAVATSLSRYCAYLVSSAPELLPDHQYTTRTIANAVLLELRGCLRGLTSDKEVLDKMKSVAAAATEGSSAQIHVRGALLWKHLKEIHGDDQGGQEEMLWELLAKVWAELMLFVTPADNAMAHVQHLKMGGELITHLWALLTHAGIVDRPTPAS